MNLIEEIIEKLTKYPQARYENSDDSISVFPTTDDGFTVSLAAHRDTYTVSFDGWHEDFRNRDDALNCFAFGLSVDCRLKECSRGGFAYKWIVEAKEYGRWIEDSETGLFLFPFWIEQEVRYLQNSLLSEGPDDAEPGS